MSDQTVPEVIRAQGFDIVDSDGQVRNTVTQSDCELGLFIYDSNGRLRGGIGLDPEGEPNLFLFNAVGELIWSAP